MDDSTSLIDRASALSRRYEELHKIEDLDQSISLGREALTLTPPAHPHRHTAVFNLANDLMDRYEKLGRSEDLEESISLNRKALALGPTDHPDRSKSLNNLAIGLRARYQQSGKMEDLQESIFLDRNVLALRPAGHPHQSISLNNLANGLNTRYQQLGKMADLEESISLDRKALALRPAGHPDRSLSINNLASSLRTRYQHMGKTEDLEESISLDREALALRPTGHPHQAISLNNLANGLRMWYQQLGKMEILEESIYLDRKALALCPTGHPLQSISINNLSNGLRMWYQQLGKMEDLEVSISLDRKALVLCPAGHLLRSSSLGNLANGLSTRYQLLGKIDDLEESISLDREALALFPAGQPDRSSCLGNLAIGLSIRYQQLGKMEDLEESISLDREALVFRPAGHPLRSSSLNNLANGLCTRYQQLRKMEDLEESISLDRNALALRPTGHPDRSSSLGNLAIDLRTRYQQSAKMEDLEESIYLDREALVLRPAGHPHQSISLNNLANGLSTRYQQLGKMEDLEESISLHCKALVLRPAGHPDRSLSLFNLAISLSTRYDQLGKMADIAEMFLCYEQAATDSTSFLRHRLDAAIVWTQNARKYQHQSLLHAYTIALELLQRSLFSRPDVEAQHVFLATRPIIGSLASDAASAAIDARNLELAVEFLERGRAMLWSKIDGYKYPLERLRQFQGGGELANELERLSAELERLVLLSDRIATSEEGHSTTHSFDTRVTRHRILSEEWDHVIGKIRTKPGFDALRLGAAVGPVIFVNISQYRSDVIILTINNPPILVPLTTVELVVLRKQADRLATNRGIIGVLRYLWENAVSPAVDCLTGLGVEQKSRIWWCTTAELCALPLHVAGPYRRGEKNLHDLYTSSYISTLSSLIRARSNIVQLSSVPQLLVIGQHDTLPMVQEEVGVIIEGFKGAVDLLLGAQASHEAVLDSLNHHSWVHFACHGHLGDDDQPFHASFELHDGRRLTLLELIQARLPNAEFAFLAACHSAAGDSRTPDENINLSAALQFCGFRSVVGTLWEMFDEDGPTISKEFYSYMFRNPGGRIDFRDSAHALNATIQKMQKAKLPPERWTMFVHIGA